MTAAEYEAIAVRAARAGGEVLKRRFALREALTIEVKSRRDYVTAVDREAERAVVEVLAEETPGFAIVAEEGSPDARGASARWIVDPLDGTTNFIHGVPTFAVSVGLEDASGLAAGAVYDPLRDEMFHARRGGGAFLGDAPIAPSRLDDLEPALIATGFPFRDMSRVGRYLEAFESFVRATSGVRRAGAASIDLVYVACGRYDGFFEAGLSPWDMAAGALVVREAGGIVTDLSGRSDVLASGSIVAAGPGLHPAMLAITRATLAR
ncbi:MAG TPA: inositol monophosphatase family protein [Candidatus Sulfotelmatobacter sp.]|nr:inositol monophosphatase family protein [Candidatus Sulfotelmatobacter sp.]